MPRTYLYVPPEEKAEVKALGAHWDHDAKCWYLETGTDPGAFTRWLPDAADGHDYNIVSTAACVVTATAPCQHCGTDIEVICIHCNSGTVDGEPLEQFTVSHIQNMDLPSHEKLSPWPQFRWVGTDGPFANHCPRCQQPQDDLFLHSEPDEPFFDVPSAIADDLVSATPLTGIVQLSGDEHFRID